MKGERDGEGWWKKDADEIIERDENNTKTASHHIKQEQQDKQKRKTRKINTNNNLTSHTNTQTRTKKRRIG